jgi:TonB family protein
MRKNFIRFLIFLITLFIGLNASKAYYLSNKPAQEFSIVSVNVPIESEQNTVITESRVFKPYKLTSCDNPNPMKQYKYPQKIHTVGGGVVNGMITCGVLPEYSQAAKAANISGKVILDVVVDENGEIIKASVQSGNPLFREATIRAAYQSRTPPRLLGGQPVKIRGILVYQFDSKSGVILPRNFPSQPAER